MNIREATNKILMAKANNLTALSLSSFLYQSRLNPEILSKLTPQIKEIVGLKHLDLSFNEITNLNFLRSLPNLESIDLSFNSLSDLDGINELKLLTKLDLSHNNINDISYLRDLKHLNHLNLEDNQLNNIEALKRLKNLNFLNIKDNQIINLDSIKDLKNISHISSLFLLPNPIKNPPKEIVTQGLFAIWKYFEDLEENGIDFIYESKVLIVGETETGKTTLFKKLTDPTYLPQNAKKVDRKSTVGINIKTWEFPYTKNPNEIIKANLWDFGGQEIQYTLHQYFLTKSSFYIFLISNRVGDNEKIHKADYWFKVISTLGRDCPVLVILNERNDSSANNFDIKKYIEQFGANLGEIEKLDVDFSENDFKWEILFETIKSKISNLSHIGEETDEDRIKGNLKGLPKKWIKIRRKLDLIAENNNYITRSAYYDICREVGLYEESKNKNTNEILSQDLLLKFLHNLGVVINFDDAYLREYLILNPNWLRTYAVGRSKY